MQPSTSTRSLGHIRTPISRGAVSISVSGPPLTEKPSYETPLVTEVIE